MKRSCIHTKTLRSVVMALACVWFCGCQAQTEMSVTKDSATLDPRDFGAKGDGVTDDTEAFTRLDAWIASHQGPVHVVIPAGVFMVNPLKTPLHEPTPGKQRRYALLTLRRDYSKVTGAGVVKIVPGVDYTAGAGGPEWVGKEWHWSVVNIRANFCTVDGLNFDGNGTGTLKGEDGSGWSVRWGAVSAFGEWDHHARHVGNKAINCTVTGGGAHPIGFQYQRQAIIANNVLQDGTGTAMSRCEDSMIVNNTSIRSHDAPYAVNACSNIVVAGNVSRGTTNGSGIDVVGGVNVVVEGNVIEDSAAWGLLIGYSAQQKMGSERVLVQNNLFVRNGRSIDTPMNGEICVGRPWSDTPDSARDITVQGNRFVLDGTHGADKGSMVSIAYGASDVEIRGNTASGALNPRQTILTVWADAQNLEITDNAWTGTGEASVLLKGRVGGGLVLESNRSIRDEPTTGKQLD